MAGFGGGAEGIDVLAHGAELVEGEGFSVMACALLAEDRGGAIGEADKEGGK